eukprot:m.4255 g.4255  ORF g.4255 m.4255 type:complete len:194 (+) comp10454_c0_seq1:93-674(+)
MSENVDFSRPQSQLRNTFPPRFYPPLQSNSFQRIFPGRFVKNSLFARNNPHPNRVTHIKGLLDAPICCVQDAMFDGRRMGLPLPVFDPRIYGQRSGMVQYPSIRERQMLAGGPGEFPVSFWLLWCCPLSKVSSFTYRCRLERRVGAADEASRHQRGDGPFAYAPTAEKTVAAAREGGVGVKKWQSGPSSSRSR